MRDTSKHLSMHTLFSAILIVVGLVLMVGKIVVDSEPGGIPILLILIGTGWAAVRIGLRYHAAKSGPSTKSNSPPTGP